MKKNLAQLIPFLAILVGLVACAGCIGSAPPASGDLQGTLNVNGSAVLSPVIAKEAAAFNAIHPNAKVISGTSSSGAGIRDVTTGKVDIGTTSQLPNPSEYALARTNGKNLYLTVISYDALGVVVNPSNPVNELTKDQLNSIFFSGTISDWSQVTNGTKTGKINVYGADPALFGTSSFFNEAVTGNRSTRYVTGYIPVDSALKLPQNVVTDPDGITYTSNNLITSEMKVLAVNKVKPTVDSVIDTTYPLGRKMYVITNGPPSDLGREFINFIMSTRGQQIISEEGLVPIV
jgi:phosphate transport system substrate-binding protein